MDSIIAYNLKDLLAEQDMAPTKLAERANMRRGAISEILNNRNRNPSIWTMVRLADALEVTVDRLVRMPT